MIAELEQALRERDEARAEVANWNRVMGEVLAGSEYYNNPKAYVVRFRQMGELILASVKDRKAAEAEVEKLREELNVSRSR